MKKKQLTAQVLLTSIGVILILLTYFYYPYLINKDNAVKDKSVMKNLDEGEIINDDQSTSFESVEYEGLYNFNEPFSVRSENAYILDKEPDIVYMTNMHVTLYLKDNRTINIISDKGKYNKITHDCFFKENVEATDEETIIFADNLDMLATENFVKIYHKVKLNNPSGSLRADQIDYDFETQYFKVSMFDEKVVKMKVIQ